MQIEYQFFKHILPFNILTARFTSLTIFFFIFFHKNTIQPIKTSNTDQSQDL